MPMQPAFRDKAWGMLTDRFGTPWIVNGELLPLRLRDRPGRALSFPGSTTFAGEIRRYGTPTTFTRIL